MHTKEFNEQPKPLEIFIQLVHFKSLHECEYFFISYNLFISLYNYILLEIDLENDRWKYHDMFVLIVDKKTINIFVGYTKHDFISFERRVKLDKIVKNI